MKDFSYENQGTHTYLVYTVSDTDVIDSMSLGMLTNNRIPGLSHVLFTQMDSTKYIKYDVSSKISVKQFFTGQVNRKRLLGVFNGIVDAMLSAEEYMIDINTILLDMDYIFADVSNCETVLICLPIISDDLSKGDILSFFKNIMFNTQFDQTENCDHVAKIINYLNSTPVFSLEDFKKLLGIIGSTTASQAQRPAVEKKTVPQVQQVVQPQAQPSVPVIQPQPTKKAAPQETSNQSKPKTIPTASSSEKSEQPEKRMSMLYLLQHYNSENAAIYKAQKATQKANKASVSRPEKQQQPQAPKKQPQTEFAIPGQEPPAFSVPSQQPEQPTSKPPVPDVSAKTSPSSVAPQPSYAVQKIPQGQTMNFGETTVLGGANNIGETTVLGATASTQVRPHLIRIKNNEKIILDKPVFRVGKERSYVDYFIADNSAISRSHANIISRDGEYFVVDTNSTNHTYVNGAMIQSNVETKIAHGTKIKLANEEFEFKLY